MSYQLPITLAVFTSCRGHFDKDTYQYTVNNLFSQINRNSFSEKVVHIKWRESEQNKLEIMRTYFLDQGFKVLESKGEWRHNDKSHYLEHAKDMNKFLRCREIQNNPYVLVLEDDIVFHGENLHKSFDEAVKFLLENPEKMCVRILDDLSIIPSLKVVEDAFPIFTHQDCYSFRANILRSRDAYILGSWFQKFSLNVHIERFATEVLRAMSGNDIPFSCFSFNYLSHVHIGMKEFNPKESY